MERVAAPSQGSLVRVAAPSQENPLGPSVFVDARAIVDLIATSLPESFSPLWIMPVSEALDRKFEDRELSYTKLEGVSVSKRQLVDPPIA